MACLTASTTVPGSARTLWSSSESCAGARRNLHCRMISRRHTGGTSQQLQQRAPEGRGLAAQLVPGSVRRQLGVKARQEAAGHPQQHVRELRQQGLQHTGSVGFRHAHGVLAAALHLHSVLELVKRGTLLSGGRPDGDRVLLSPLSPVLASVPGPAGVVVHTARSLCRSQGCLVQDGQSLSDHRSCCFIWSTVINCTAAWIRVCKPHLCSLQTAQSLPHALPQH